MTVCRVHFSVHPEHLGGLLNAASGTSPPRNLNSGVWGWVRSLRFHQAS